MPRHQNWMSGGKFDGSDFTDEQKRLFGFYKKLLNFRLNSDAINKGAFYDLMWVNPWYSNFDPQYVYAFLRYHDEERLLVVINFKLDESRCCKVKISDDALEYMNLTANGQMLTAIDVMTSEEIQYNINDVGTQGIEVNLKPADVKILKL